MKALAFVLFLAAPSTLIVDTSQIKAGQAQIFTMDDTVRVTVRRDGDVRRVSVERLGTTNEYTIERVDGVLRITTKNVDPFEVISPHRITIDGLTLDGSWKFTPPPPAKPRALIYICPKDETMLRVPHSDHDGEFKCPVDGTLMRPSARPNSPYFLLK